MVGTAGSKFNTLVADLDAVAVALRRDVLPAVTAVVAKADQTAAGAERTARAAESLVDNDLRQLVTALRQEVIPQVQAVLRSADEAVQGAGGCHRHPEAGTPAHSGKAQDQPGHHPGHRVGSEAGERSDAGAAPGRGGARAGFAGARESGRRDVASAQQRTAANGAENRCRQLSAPKIGRAASGAAPCGAKPGSPGDSRRQRG